MARKKDDGLILQGDVYARNRQIDGAGSVLIGNTTKLELKSESEKKERISKQRDTFGQALDSLTSPKPVAINFDLDTFDRYNLVMALMGKDRDLTRDAADIADEAVVIGKRGQWFRVANDYWDESKEITLKTASGDVVDKALYEINPRLGMIKIADNSSTIKDGDTVSLSYSIMDKNKFQIDAGGLTSFDLELIVDGKNRITGEDVRLEIPSAVISADAAIDWFGDDFVTASFSGVLVTVDGKAPYSLIAND